MVKFLELRGSTYVNNIHRDQHLICLHFPTDWQFLIRALCQDYHTKERNSSIELWSKKHEFPICSKDC